MKKVALILLFLISSNSWSASCTEYASLVVVLKLRDMLTGISDSYYTEISDDRDRTIIPKNRYSLTAFCKNDDIEDTIVAIKKGSFKSCDLRNIESSLDLPENSIENERLVTLASNSISNFESCPSEVNIKGEDNLVAATKNINKELSKDRPNITLVCNIAREAFQKNDDLRYNCM